MNGYGCVSYMYHCLSFDVGILYHIMYALSNLPFQSQIETEMNRSYRYFPIGIIIAIMINTARKTFSANPPVLILPDVILFAEMGKKIGQPFENISSSTCVNNPNPSPIAPAFAYISYFV